MLGILYGLQTTITNRFDAPAQLPLPTKCSNALAPFHAEGSCITLGFVDSSTDAVNRTTNWRTLQILAKYLGWTMSDAVGDLSTSYDVVYFGTNQTQLEEFRYNSMTYVKFVLTHNLRNEYFGISYNRMSPDSYYAQVGGPVDFNMNSFGFLSTLSNPETQMVSRLEALMMDAYIAYRQVLRNGWSYHNAIFPDIQFKPAAWPSSNSGGGGGGGSDSTETWIWLIGGPLIIWTSLFASQLFLSSQILEDRRKKLRLGMVMMGLNTGAYQVSWFFFHILLSFFYSLISLGIGHACKFTFFTKTNAAIIILLYWCTSWGAIGFTMLTTSLVHHPTGHTAVMVFGYLIGLVLAVLSSLPLLYPVFWVPSGAAKVWSVNYCFQFGNVMRSIAQKVLSSDGSNGPSSPGVLNAPPPYFSWSDIYHHSTLDTGNQYPVIMPSVANSFCWMLLCGILGLVCSIYLEIVFPREIGSPQGFGFFFMPSYWGFDTRSRLNVETVAIRANKMSDVATDLDPDILAEYNDVMTRLNSGDASLALAITKLSKTFKKKRTASEQDTRAVDSVTLGADTGSVLGIVGHNGAGKTTLMSMLCGVVEVSTGDARVFGHSISQNMTAIHSVMGVCPQEDVLWPELTPTEHLKLFAMLKRIPMRDHDKVIADSLNEVGLYDVRHRIVNKLSGGMKRRLSVAVALIGNIKIIMLDEPTAGLDPRNRLEIWSIIERIKQNRVVILTTHSMVEASTLADKIAVMAVGRLRAVGSPQHLIQRFGKGHQINIITKVSKSEEVKELMNELLPDAELQVDTGARLTFSLASSKSRQLPEFCKYMEKENKVNGLVEDWGISQTTLEQVFLTLTHGGGNQEGLNNAASLQLNVSIEGSDDVLGFVAILATTTFDEVREMMLPNESFPKDFVFILNHAPVSRSQERSTTAYRALPLVEIRLVSQAAPPRSKASASPPSSMDVGESETIEALKLRIHILEEQLKDRETLILTIDTLQQKVQKLKAKLKALQHDDLSS